MDKLKKELGLMDVFCLASGAMISSGLFVLPAIIYAMTGPAVVLVYFAAGLLMLPAVLSQAELVTAMPKAGGTYFFVNRSLGTAFGFFAGLSNWFFITAKSAFAIAGIAVFVRYILEINNLIPDNSFVANVITKGVSVGFCVFFMILNIYSVKSTSRFQIYLVWGLLAILVFFIIGSYNSIDISRFQPFFPDSVDWKIFLTAAATVFISYGGLDYASSVAEEIHDPVKTLPIGLFTVWFVISAMYFICVAVTVAVVPGTELAASLTPLSLAARSTTGMIGFVLVSVAAMLAFITTGNAGLLSASRCPLAMSRDKLLPPLFSKVHPKYQTPYVGIIATGMVMIAALVALELTTLVKTASCLMIILYILANVSVIVMRESRIMSYRPAFKCPGYPYLQIFAIIVYTILMMTLGMVPVIISISVALFSFCWFMFYLSKRVSRNSAVMRIVDRVSDKAIKTTRLETELREILIERDSITEDRFDCLIKDCEILDIEEAKDFNDAFGLIADCVSKEIGYDPKLFYNKLCSREAQGSTVIMPGLAIPHVIIDGDGIFDIMIVRSISGIKFPHSDDPVHCIFVLTGTLDERNYHLRALMAVAQIAQSPNFKEHWLSAKDTHELKNMILLANRRRD